MNTRRRIHAALVAAAATLAACSLAGMPALAASSQNPVITDCLQHPSGLTGHYTVAQLTRALETMSAETKEYTSCPDVIARARLAAIAHGGTFTGSGGSSSFLPTWVIIILVVLILAAVTFGALAIRRQRQAGGPGGGSPGGDGPAGPSDA